MIKNRKTGYVDYSPVILFIGLTIAAIVITGITPQVRNIMGPFHEPEEACLGRAGQEITIEGRQYLALPNPSNQSKPCLLTKNTKAEDTTGRDTREIEGRWINDGETAVIIATSGEQTAILHLKDSHSGLIPGNRATQFTILGAIIASSLLISLTWAGVLHWQNRKEIADPGDESRN